MQITKKQSKIIDVDQIGTVILQRNSRAKRLIIRIKPFQQVQVTVPRHISYKNAERFVQSKAPWIKKQLKKIKALKPHPIDIDEKQAGRKILQRTDDLATKHGLSHNGITLRRQKTRWGSCSAKNKLSLNIMIACLPPQLMDYIILHELLHIRIKNHSPLFWRELDKLVGNAKAIDRQLKKYHPLMYRRA